MGHETYRDRCDQLRHLISSWLAAATFALNCTEHLPNATMIPPFDETGCLPNGVYPATLDEIDAHFGQLSELRRVQMESVKWMVELARRAGVVRIVLNGSFVTDIMEPNDVDCVLLIERGFPADAVAESELNAGLPFIEMKLVRQAEFDEYVNVTFGSDRMGNTKGMIEVVP